LLDSLTALLAELHLKIFDLLEDDPEASACLGLICKTFYPLFTARHLKIKLIRQYDTCGKNLDGPPSLPEGFSDGTLELLSQWIRRTTCDSEGHKEGWRSLCHLLKDWKPISLIYIPYPNKFVTIKRTTEILKEESERFEADFARSKRERMDDF
jgi:hypothetical protein